MLTVECTFGSRYYDPDTARFITQDSYLGESNTPPSLHRYLYAYSNPTIYIDLLGYEVKLSETYSRWEENFVDYQVAEWEVHNLGKPKKSMWEPKNFGFGPYLQGAMRAHLAKRSDLGVDIEKLNFVEITEILAEDMAFAGELERATSMLLTGWLMRYKSAKQSLNPKGRNLTRESKSGRLIDKNEYADIRAYKNYKTQAKAAGETPLGRADFYKQIRPYGSKTGFGTKTKTGAPKNVIGNIGSKISQKQLRHIKGHKNWIQRGRGGYLNSTDDAQSVLDALHSGKAKVLGQTKQGHVVVKHDKITGFNNNPSAGFIDQPTNVFIIKGTSKPSVVPTSPLWKP